MTPDKVVDAITGWGMVAVAVLVILWDVVLGAVFPRFGVWPKTESQIIAETAREWNVLPFLLGALLGHWLFNRPSQIHYEWWPYALVCVGGVLALDLVEYFWNPTHGSWQWIRWPGVWAALGIPAGSFLWPQRLPASFFS